MATSITKLSIGIEGDATPILSTIDHTKNAMAGLSKDASKIGGAGLRRAFGGMGGDIGGRFADQFGGSLIAGLGIGGGIGIAGALMGKLLPSIDQVGEAISDLFSNKEGKALSRELRDSAGWAENLGKNIGTTTDIMAQFAEASKKTQGGLFGGSTAAGMRTIRLRNELLQRGVDFQQDLSRMTGQDISIARPTDTSAEGMADWMQQLNRLRTRVESAGSLSIATPGMRPDAAMAQNAMTTQLGLMGAEARLANPTAGDDMARDMIRANGMMVESLSRGAEGMQDFRLETMGASDALREQARMSLRAAEGARLTEANRSPVDRFNQERERLDTLLAGGFINDETYALQAQSLVDALPQVPELRASGASLAGSQEALSAITRFQLSGVAGRNDPNARLAQAQAVRQQQLARATETVASLRRIESRPPVVVVEARI